MSSAFLRATWILICTIPISLFAQDCRPPEPEGELFSVFFARFQFDTHFALTRTAPTNPPSELIKWTSTDGIKRNKQFIETNILRFASNISEFQDRSHASIFRRTQNREQTVVHLYSASLRYDIWFELYGGCWYLTHISQGDPRALDKYGDPL